jgi:hypothetical protein
MFETIGHRRSRFQVALAILMSLIRQLRSNRWLILVHYKTKTLQALLKVVRKADDADGDQIDGHDIVKEARHQQDENTGDQGDQGIDQDWINGHRFFPVKMGREGLIRLPRRNRA